MMIDVHVSSLPGARRTEAIAVLARAFHADPVYRRLVPDPRRRARVLQVLFHLAVSDASRFGAVDVAATGDRMLGVGVWLAPGRFPMTAGRKLHTLPGLLALLRAAPRSFAGVARLGAGIAAAHPPEPSWYLQAIGVDPTAQGRGTGSRLLADGLARADHARVPATLETAVPAAAALYERFGFRTTSQDLQLIAEGPAHQPMRRLPAADPSRPSRGERA